MDKNHLSPQNTNLLNGASTHKLFKIGWIGGSWCLINLPAIIGRFIYIF
jgi:hypothetical protein